MAKRICGFWGSTKSYRTFPDKQRGLASFIIHFNQRRRVSGGRISTAANWGKRLGMKKSPISQMTSSLDGGVMGEGGCPSRGEASIRTFGFRRMSFSQFRNIRDSNMKVNIIL